MRRRRGTPGSRRSRRSTRSCANESIECDFEWVPGYLHAPRDASRQKDDVDFRGRGDARGELGFDAAFVDDVPLMGGPGVRFDDQARFHPRKYLAGLARAIVDAGGRIYEHTEAREFSDEPLQRQGQRPHDHRATTSSSPRTTRWSGLDEHRVGHAVSDQAGALYELCHCRPRRERGASPTRCSGIPPIRTTTCGSSRIATTTWSSSAARITRPDRPTTRTNATTRSSGGSSAGAGHRGHAPLVGPGDRDAGRPAVYRRNADHQYTATASPATA